MLIQTSEFLAFLRKNPGGTIMKSDITFLQYQDGSIDDFVEHSKKQIDTQIMTNLTRPNYDQRELIFFGFHNRSSEEKYFLTLLIFGLMAKGRAVCTADFGLIESRT